MHVFIDKIWYNFLFEFVWNKLQTQICHNSMSVSSCLDYYIVVESMY